MTGRKVFWFWTLCFDSKDTWILTVWQEKSVSDSGHNALTVKAVESWRKKSLTVKMWQQKSFFHSELDALTVKTAEYWILIEKIVENQNLTDKTVDESGLPMLKPKKVLNFIKALGCSITNQKIKRKILKKHVNINIKT